MILMSTIVYFSKLIFEFVKIMKMNIYLIFDISQNSKMKIATKKNSIACIRTYIKRV